MKPRISRLRLIVSFGISLTGAFTQADDHVEPLVAGLLARTEALVSGRLEYVLTTGFAGQPKRITSRPIKLVFQHSSWKLEYPQSVSQLQYVNHEDKLITYRQHPQPDGRTERMAGVSPARDINAGGPPYQPVHAGTIWLPQTIDYLRQHAGRARVAGVETVNGVESHVLEWDVPREDRYRAFYAITSPNDNGGILRLYVAPALGYALPRIEHLSPKGELTLRIDAGGFQEYNGIYLPSASRYQVFTPSGQASYFIQHEMQKISQINEAMDEQEFSVHVAEGTEVADMRGPGGAKIFEAHRGLVPKDIAAVMRVGPETRGSWLPILLGTLSGALLLFIFWRLRRFGSGS